MLIVLVMIHYGSIKFMRFISGNNPRISSFIDSGSLDSSTVLNFRDHPIHIAYGIEGYTDLELKDD